MLNTSIAPPSTAFGQVKKGWTIGGSLALSGRDVHVWTLRIGVSDAVAARFEPFLTPDEKRRAERLRFCHLYRSFVTTRGFLRCLLGHYLGLHPANISFKYGLKGKPAVASSAGIEFNATHSSGLAVFVFTLDCQIGIDLEQIHPVTEMQHVADCFFCPEEAGEIRSLPPRERQRGFFSCWTRKEAYIKATGDGLSAPLNEFRVALQPNEPVRFIHLSHDTSDAAAWMLHDLGLAPGYAAAMAYRDRPRPISIFPVIDPAEFNLSYPTAIAAGPDIFQQ